VHLFRLPARDLALKIRYTLKNGEPLSAVQNNVVRQRSAVHREDRFKRLIEFIGSCSYNSKLASWNLQLFQRSRSWPGTRQLLKVRNGFHPRKAAPKSARFGHPVEPALKACPKILLFGVSCSVQLQGICFLSLFFVVSNMVFLEAKLHLKLKASSRFLGSLSLRRRMAKRLRITVHSFQLHLVVLAAARKSTSPSARLLQVR